MVAGALQVSVVSGRPPRPAGESPSDGKSSPRDVPLVFRAFVPPALASGTLMRMAFAVPKCPVVTVAE